jgi:LysM repeat protein
LVRKKRKFASGFFEGKPRRKKQQHLSQRRSRHIKMNNQSPLIPQGSFLEQKNKGRARVKIAVFVVLAIHGIGLMALLMQGCKKEPEASSASSEATNNTAPAFAPPTNVLAAVTNVVTNVTTAIESVPPPPLPPINPTEYKVLKGDTFSTIARKFHTTTKAITDVNPGIDATKLQIGQTLHIPPPTVSGGTAAPPVNAAAGEQVYTVKSGDTLIGIAAQYKVTVKALRSANSLTTDKIVVGQKLKIPSSGTTVATNGTVPGATGAPPTSTPSSGQ